MTGAALAIIVVCGYIFVGCTLAVDRIDDISIDVWWRGEPTWVVVMRWAATWPFWK